jgi:hypothetical protein
LRRDVPAGASQFSASGIFTTLPAGDRKARAGGRRSAPSLPFSSRIWKNWRRSSRRLATNKNQSRNWKSRKQKLETLNWIRFLLSAFLISEFDLGRGWPHPFATMIFSP